MPIIGLLRVRNEARWIDSVVRAILPVCERILILDDNSDDATPQICAAIPRVTVFRSDRSSFDESADKDWLLTQAYEYVPEQYRSGNPESPWWGLLVDGDEELMAEDLETVAAMPQSDALAFRFRVPYLWNDENTIRVDGVYTHMAQVGRPSMFRLMNERFRFHRTPFGNGQNFHCSSVPQELLHYARPSTARLKHWGYMHAEDRIRKYHWYRKHDPDNVSENFYQHIVVGDLFPADSVFTHGGPLRLEPLLQGEPCRSAA